MIDKITFSAPGNLMIMGEHAVLKNHKCISAAISSRVKINLYPKKNTKIINIKSELGNYSCDLQSIYQKEIKSFPNEFKFILASIKSFNIKTGMDLEILSEFPSNIGLGSSAAITVSMIACLMKLNSNYKLDILDENILKTIFNKSYEVILKIQNNKGSGYDIATSIWGGVISYNKEPFKVEKIHNNIPIHIFYSGYKTKTEDVISLINKKEIKYKSIYYNIYKIINELVDHAIKFIKEEKWVELGALFNINQGLLDAIGVCDKKISEMIYSLKELGVLGTKISGSGLGDCIIALMDNDLNISKLKFSPINIKTSNIGLQDE